MIEHGIVGLTRQALLAELARLIAPAGIEGRGGAADDVLSGVLGHGGRLDENNRSASMARFPANGPAEALTAALRLRLDGGASARISAYSRCGLLEARS